MLGKSRLLAQIIVVSGEGKLKGADNVRSHQGEPIGLSDARALRIPHRRGDRCPVQPLCADDRSIAPLFKARARP
jgi:hypothetical protein